MILIVQQLKMFSHFCVCVCVNSARDKTKKITLVIFNAYYDGLLFSIHTMAFPYQIFYGFSIVRGVRIGIIDENQR